MSNLQSHCCLKFDFQKVDQDAGGKWLIHDTKRRKDNQLQILWLYTYSVIVVVKLRFVIHTIMRNLSVHVLSRLL